LPGKKERELFFLGCLCFNEYITIGIVLKEKR